MAVTRILRPPLDAQDTSSWVWKKWFNDQYLYSKSGVLIPTGGSTNIVDIPYIYGGSRNFFDNGDFQVWQRGTSIASTGATSYTADRWATFRAANTQIVSRQLSGLNGFTYCARVERAAADALTTNMFFVTPLETVRTLPLIGHNMYLSFWLRVGAGFNEGTTPLRFQIDYSTTVDLTPFAASIGAVLTYNLPTKSTTWTYYSVPIPAANLVSTTNSIKAYWVWAPSNVAGANNYIEVTGVQLEIGTRPTAFDYVPFDTSIIRCKRYYQKSFPYAIAPAQNAGNTGATIYSCMRAGANAVAIQENYNTQLRTAPTTVTYYNPGAANAKWRNASLAADSGVAATQLSDERRLSIQNPQVAGDALGNLLLVHWTADAEL